jgi:hypothetical protein
MATATDACPGCSRRFAPGGFSNHLQLSRDPRCVFVRDGLRPTYPSALDQEPPHSPTVIDVEMIELSDTESVTLVEQVGHVDTTMDANISHCRDYQPTLEEAPDLIPHLSSTSNSVIFDSDTEDSDEDDDQDQTSHLEPETLSGPGDAMDTDTERVSQIRMFVYVVHVLGSD